MNTPAFRETGREGNLNTTANSEIPSTDETTESSHQKEPSTIQLQLPPRNYIAKNHHRIRVEALISKSKTRKRKEQLLGAAQLLDLSSYSVDNSSQDNRFHQIINQHLVPVLTDTALKKSTPQESPELHGYTIKALMKTIVARITKALTTEERKEIQTHLQLQPRSRNVQTAKRRLTETNTENEVGTYEKTFKAYKTVLLLKQHPELIEIEEHYLQLLEAIQAIPLAIEEQMLNTNQQITFLLSIGKIVALRTRKEYEKSKEEKERSIKSSASARLKRPEVSRRRIEKLRIAKAKLENTENNPTYKQIGIKKIEEDLITEGRKLRASDHNLFDSSEESTTES